MNVLDLFSLKGKVALATGGAGLYGRQVVEALAEAGAKTFTAARNHDALEKVAAALRGRGLDVTALQYDQSEEASVLALRDQVLEQAGGIDILVNNSVARPMKDGYQSDASTFAHSMAVNATGLFVITRAFGDVMAENGRGSIINVGSIQGLIAPDPSIYRGTAMSGWAPDYFFHKGGMVNFTRFIGSYYGLKNVRCNCIAPGGYQTPDHPEAFVRQYSDKTFLGRLASDTDLKGVVVFLASDASAYITGATIPVDAGYTAK
ncbi:MAG: SDR family oxidoreductase [Candidatus Hydrogenedentales bacterium]|jgi:NAD(P)-dependent dehydrogenase (short-subunit alcohol dehydrogenase family)